MYCTRAYWVESNDLYKGERTLPEVYFMYINELLRISLIK